MPGGKPNVDQPRFHAQGPSIFNEERGGDFGCPPIGSRVTLAHLKISGMMLIFCWKGFVPMIKKLHYFWGMTGLLAACVSGCTTKPGVAIASQSEAVCVGSNIDRDVLMSQRDLGWTFILPNDDPTGWTYPAY